MLIFQNHICSRQIKRQEDEIEKLDKLVEDGKAREKDLVHQTKELMRKISNIESKVCFVCVVIIPGNN